MPIKKKTTRRKAIAETVAASGQGNNKSKDMSVVARSSQFKALSPKQAYELSIHARKAVDGKANQMAKAKLRFFSRNSGEEILDGDVMRLYRRPSKYCTTHTLVRDELVWLNVQGEFAQWARGLGDLPGARPRELHVLDPNKLTEYPNQAMSFETVTKWQYINPFEFTTPGGSVISAMMEIPVENIALGKLFNPNDKIRGLSPMLTGGLEISTNYFINRYNASFFQNGAQADIIFRFPKGTKKEVAEAYVEEWQLRHSFYQGNGFGISAFIGDEIQVEQTNQTAKDGQFLQLLEWNAEQIGGLFGVPPSVMGFLSKTRFDTIDVELESFAENTLMPEMFLWSEVQQTQVIDRFFKDGAKGTKKEKGRLGHYMKKALEQARDERVESDIIILLDPDTLPIMSKMLTNKFSLIKSIREAADLSANEAAEYAGVELPSRPERDDIWVANNRMNISADAIEAQQQQQDQQDQQPQQEDQQKEVEVDPEKLKNLQQGYRQYRAIACEAADSGEIYGKADVLKLLGEEAALQVHKDFLELRKIIKSADEPKERVKKVKEYLKPAMKSAALRQLLGGTGDIE